MVTVRFFTGTQYHGNTVLKLGSDPHRLPHARGAALARTKHGPRILTPTPRAPDQHFVAPAPPAHPPMTRKNTKLPGANAPGSIGHHGRQPAVSTSVWRCRESNPGPCRLLPFFYVCSRAIATRPPRFVRHCAVAAQSLFGFPPAPVTGAIGESPSDVGSRFGDTSDRRQTYCLGREGVSVCRLRLFGSYLFQGCFTRSP